MKKPALFFFCCFLFFYGWPQSQFSGWFASFNTIKLHNKFSLHFDGQLRSTDQLKNLQTTLIRPGLNYHFNKNVTGTAGYAYIGNRRTISGITEYLAEHRIWQQVLVAHPWASVSTLHRFRLEQRFVPTLINRINFDLQVGERELTHRFRYFIRNIIPLQKGTTFSEGPFLAIQNEVFLNIANKEAANGKFFDQNRLYGAIGYRINSKIDVDAGYMNQYSKTAGGSLKNHIVHLAVYTRL